MQAHNNHVNSSPFGCFQNRLTYRTHRPKFYVEFRSDLQRGIPSEFFQSAETGYASVLSHLHDIGRSEPVRVFRYRDRGDDME